MGRLVRMTASGVLVLGLAVAGCGGSSSTSSTRSESASQTSSQTGTGAGTQSSSSAPSGTQTSSAAKEHLPTNLIRVSSSAFTEGGAIPVRYTCDGAGTSPPLQWTGVPGGTAELFVFITNLEVKAPGGGELISWAVGGLKPPLAGISAGKLPAGAVVGRNSFGHIGYTLCPPKGSPLQHYVVVVYALLHPLSVKPGFAAGTVFKTVSHTAEYSGLAGYSYKRK